MTALQLDATVQLQDALAAMGLSLVLWFCYHLMTLLIPRKQVLLAWVMHLLFFAAAGLVCFCFVVGRTSLGVVRWYLAAGFAAGAAAYVFCFAGMVKRAVNALKKLVCRVLAPLRWIWQKGIMQPCMRVHTRLQNRRQLRYNQRKEKKRRRKQKKEEQQKGNPERGQKKPRKAYTQT